MKMKPCSVVYSCQFQPGERREMKAEKRISSLSLSDGIGFQGFLLAS
jgi:hypothetical protein